MQFSALAKHEEAASRSSSGADTGIILSYENIFEKEMFLLNGVIDLWYVETFTEEETAWLELTALHMAKIY